MTRKVLSVVLCCFLLTSAAFAQAKPAEKKVAAARADVPDRQLMQKINDAWATMNVDNAAQYYDKKPTDVFYDLSPLKYTGWQEYADASRKMFAMIESLKFTTYEDATVHHAGSTAWGTATVHADITMKDGKSQSLDCRWTVVWEKKGASWLVVHEHFSAPMPLQ